MPYTSKPSTHPDFATQDFVDPGSGQNNVAEPSAGKKDAGWDVHETPPRQYFNWMHRFTGLWIHYFEDETDNLFSDVQTILDTLGDATRDETPDTLVLRDANGRFRAVDPSAAQDVATKAYVDAAASAAAEFSSGTRMLFFQASAPSGWSIDAGANDRAVIIDSNNGNSTGGSWTISGLNVGGHALTESEMPIHKHQAGAYIQADELTKYGTTDFNSFGPGLSGGGTGVEQPWTESVGGGQPHDHPISHSGAWRPRHIKGIICQKD